MTKKPTKNQRYVANQQAKGLRAVTVWIPEYAADDLRDLSANVCEFYLEKGEFHKRLIPAMYRDENTGVMGNKSLSEVKSLTEKNK